MSAIYLDCFSGISGNMILGALLDAGLPEDKLRGAIAKLSLSGFEISIKSVEKKGIHAVYVDVRLGRFQRQHRHLPDIIEIIHRADLPEPVKADSVKVFQRLAEAEAKVHSAPVDHIHFHEVGAADAIIDIVGSVYGFHFLGISEIYCSRLHVGSGFVKCSHGVMPVPAPATAELLHGIPYYSGDVAKELVTPTGAAIVATLGTGFGGMPADFISRSTGYGAGTWDLEIPNVLRLHLGERNVRTHIGTEGLYVLETNIDDMNPQYYNYVMDKVFALGALDVWLTPIIMKKGRPANTLSMLISADLLETVSALVLQETSSIGMRYYPVRRSIASRTIHDVPTPWGRVRLKVSRHEGRICNISPEYEDCRQLALQQNVPLKAVAQAALQAAYDSDSV
ncbi:nickel pincer cofactor biosynthesis protein LarC [Acetonema longum]|uniref:Pyridinium-3,5-bisthiocarboxylic acid mononucleotide nickel insertion protein n=1 Tax=Acetonema longum DSM 6540 TaxID=1009370 RepID=F7NPS2_9FIRM|nr:nickel pincer cofactor biosynthesis protein LarC [Acetonema longum]EGO61913.1 hypothetical protein ALO_20597 [Acetonema longum DSM 6540]